MPAASVQPVTDPEYYIKEVAAYYMDGKEGAGRWYNPAGLAMGQTSGEMVTPEQIKNVFDKRFADGSEIPASEANKKNLDRVTVPTWDLTLGMPKTISAARAVADDETKARLDRAIDRALKTALDRVTAVSLTTRRGKDGQGVAEHVESPWMVFHHREARPTSERPGDPLSVAKSDPHEHFHCVVSAIVQREDGTWGSLDGRAMFRAQHVADAALQAALARELAAEGFKVEQDPETGATELAGVPKQVRETWSSRRAEVVKHAAAAGVDNQSATMLSRQAKSKGLSESAEERDERWQAEGAAMGWTAEKVRDLWDRPMPPPGAVLAPEHSGMSGTNRAAAFQMPQAVRRGEVEVLDRRARADEAPANSMVPGIADPSLEEWALAICQRENEALLSHERLIQRATYFALQHKVNDPDAADRIIQAAIERGWIVQMAQPGPADEVLYSSRRQLEMEQDLRSLSRAAAATQDNPNARHKLAPESVAAVAGRLNLKAEQKAALEWATLGADWAVIEGSPGAGKSYTARAIAESYRQAGGYKVVGTALSHQQAADLGAAIDGKATAAADWISKLSRGKERWDDRTVVVIDEAGQLDVEQLHALLRHARNAGAKVVMLGDRDQQQPVGAGSGLRIVAGELSALRLDEIVRQNDLTHRKAVLDIRKGDIEAALKVHADKTVWADDTAASVQAVAERVVAARAKGQSIACAAVSHGEVDAINETVRAMLVERGDVSSSGVRVSDVRGRKLDFAAGDEIRYCQTGKGSAEGLVNGSRLRILEIRDVPGVGRVWKVEGLSDEVEGRTFEISERDLRHNPKKSASADAEGVDEKAAGRLSIRHAYAGTLQSVQGQTRDVGVMMVGPNITREQLFVLASRHKDEFHLVVNRADIELKIRGRQTITERRETEVTLDDCKAYVHEAWAREGKKRNASDFQPREGEGQGRDTRREALDRIRAQMERSEALARRAEMAVDAAADRAHVWAQQRMDMRRQAERRATEQRDRDKQLDAWLAAAAKAEAEQAAQKATQAPPAPAPAAAPKPTPKPAAPRPAAKQADVGPLPKVPAPAATPEPTKTDKGRDKEATEHYIDATAPEAAPAPQPTPPEPVNLEPDSDLPAP